MSVNISHVKQKLNSLLTEEKKDQILEEAAKKVYEDIYSMAPVDTGAYRSSIKISSIKKDGALSKIEIYSDLDSGWNGVPLGYLLEWGTGKKGEDSNTFKHGYSYRQTPWIYYNERYQKWIFTYGCIARPHFYPGLHLNEDYFKKLILKEVTK